MKAVRNILSYALLILLAATTIAPFVWMLVTSLHPQLSPLPTPDRLFSPESWHPENYLGVLMLPELPVWRFALNSVVVTAGVILLQLALCSTAAYALSRISFPGRGGLFLLFMLTMMIPAQVMIVPLYMITRELGLLDTYAGLIVPFQYLNTAFGTFLLRQYFISLPRSLDDAARIDGCGDWGIFWYVILPSARPALATLAVFGFIWTWTDFYWPLLATSSLNMRTLEVGLSIVKDSQVVPNWPLQMAAAVVVVTPVLAFFLVMQRFFVRGVVMSGLKA